MQHLEVSGAVRHIYIYVCQRVCTYVGVYVCVYIYVRMYVCTYVLMCVCVSYFDNVCDMPE